MTAAMAPNVNPPSTHGIPDAPSAANDERLRRPTATADTTASATITPSKSATTATTSAAPNSPVPPPEFGNPAGPYLRYLAETIQPAPYEQHTGRYAAIHVTTWATDGDLENNVITMVRYGERRWRAADASGVVVTTWPGRRPDTQTFRPGQLMPPAITLPTQAGQLAAVIGQHQPWHLIGSAAAIRGIADLSGWYTLTRPQRAAALNLLATRTDLRYLGPTTDRVGRPGIAIAYDHADGRDLLIIDPHTGVVLISPYTSTQPGSPPLPTETYVLYADIRRDHRPPARP